MPSPLLDAVTRITDGVGKLIDAYQGAQPSTTDEGAAADALNAVADRIDAALNPPAVPAPVPAVPADPATSAVPDPDAGTLNPPS